MPSTLDISRFLEKPEIHHTYIQRYRANFLMREVWNILHERSSWHVIATKPTHLESRGGGSGAPSAPTSRSYAHVNVPECFFLGVKKHALNLWQGDLRLLLQGQSVINRGQPYAGLSPLEKAEVQAFLKLEKFTHPFHEDRRNHRMARNTDYPLELEYGVLKIVEVAEVV
jgi:hypothetical protein